MPRPRAGFAPNALDQEIAGDMARFTYDPLNFLRYTFPWTSSPSAFDIGDGPDAWQAEVASYIGQSLKTSDRVVRVAVSSGHGVGKSALASWLIHWFMSTRPHANIVVTANTKIQLQTKLWRELALWHKRAINAHWFDWMATSFRSAEHPETWVANAVPWSDTNPEAFAGLHGTHVMVLMDEASAIPDIIWDTAEGANTTTKVLFVVLGNPTRSSGRFFDCFHDRKHLWKTFCVDSRSAKMTNKAQLQEWIETYGEDSDFVRVRIYGQFPRVGDVQFFPTPLIEQAQAKSPLVLPDDYLVLGVDVARFGDDSSIITMRRSNHVESQTAYRGLDTMQLASQVAKTINDTQPDTVFVDGVGLGAGVVDRLRQLNFRRVVDVQSASTPNDPRYLNKRAEMFGELRDWLRGDVAIPTHQELKAQLLSIEYGLNEKGKIQLISKKDLKARGLPSPDRADSLALTFAEPIKRVRAEASEASFAGLARYRSKVSWRTA